MTRLIKAIIAMLCIATTFLSANAQKGYETSKLFLRIEYVECSGEGNSPCYVTFALNDMGILRKGTIVTIRSAYSEETKEPKDLFTIVADDDYHGEGYLPITQEQADRIAKENGKLAVANVSSPCMGYRGIFSELAEGGILFKTAGDEEFFSYDLHWMDSPDFEELMLRQMTDDIHFTAAQMRATMEPFPLKGGIHGGKNLLDAMEATQAWEVRAFLGYVLMRPGIYRGGTWKISEVYATWLAEESPMVSNAYFDQLLDLQQKGQGGLIRPIVAKWQPEEAREVVRYAVDQSIQKLRSGDNKEAQGCLEVAMSVATQLDDIEMMAWTKLHIGRINSGTDEAKAIAAYNEAEALFAKAGRICLQVRTLADLAQSYNLAHQPKAALKASKKGQYTSDNWTGTVMESGSFDAILEGDLYTQMGIAYLALNDDAEAEEYLWGALDYLEALESAEGLRKAGRCYTLMAEIHTRRGETDQANEYRQQAEKLIQMAMQAQ